MWHSQIQDFLQQEQYEKVTQFYEQILETETDVLSHYWYLGLAYLLQGQEAEAQMTWLFPLSQGSPEDIGQYTIDLLTILEQEAKRQEKLEKYEMSWLIRGHLNEIDDRQLPNYLMLINLEIQLNYFGTKRLNEWPILELLQEELPDLTTCELIFKTLIKLIKYPSDDVLEIFRASLPYIQEPELLTRNVISVIANSAYQVYHPSFAAELVRLCLQLQPNNLYLKNSLFLLYKADLKYVQAWSVAQQIYQENHQLSLKVHSNSLMINILLEEGSWLEADVLIQQQKQLLIELIQEKNKINELFVRDALPTYSNIFPYYQDNPQENRWFQNQLSQFFQTNLQSDAAATSLESRPQHSRLKIGYISHTLRRHSVGWLSRWIFQYRNRDQFEISLYLINQPEDELTQKWFRANVDYTYNLPPDPEKIAAQIKHDEIDILVDLDSITKNTTCAVMALKPAPIQVTWLGLDASGLSTIDYFLADAYVLPEEAQSYYQEKIWSLPDTYLAVDGFEVGIPTLTREDLKIPDDAIVYLSGQSGFKRHPDTIRLQMKILKAVPKSFLLIKGTNFLTAVQNLFTQIAQEENIELNRLKFLPADATEEVHRANLQIADVVLDTYPYNGATTTLEVLWMEIPLVTRVGQQFAARNSYTFMINAGIDEGIAWTDEEYVTWGIRLGTDETLRQQICWKLKQSKKTSPLWNARQFTFNLENAYQQMWSIFCQDSHISLAKVKLNPISS